MPLYRASQFDKNKYIYIPSNIGDIQKKGSLMKALRTSKEVHGVVFEIKHNGTIDVSQVSMTDIKKIKNQMKNFRKNFEKDNGKVKYWDVTMIMSGDKWYMRKDLDKVVESFADSV